MNVEGREVAIRVPPLAKGVTEYAGGVYIWRG